MNSTLLCLLLLITTNNFLFYLNKLVYLRQIMRFYLLIVFGRIPMVMIITKLATS